mmetsp:Transcript_5131/g.12794  ORF Transcript_5131/g.12794 Transcript_5131/m.12794 type:complete len:81 (-) Transcript_5131:928-1170(-)
MMKAVVSALVLSQCGLAGAARVGVRTAGFRTSAFRMAAVGDSVPSVSMDYLFPPEKVNMAERLKGKKTIVVGLPGAFTPT